jgi:hypothetical protein
MAGCASLHARVSSNVGPASNQRRDDGTDKGDGTVKRRELIAFAGTVFLFSGQLTSVFDRHPA